MPVITIINEANSITTNKPLITLLRQIKGGLFRNSVGEYRHEGNKDKQAELLFHIPSFLPTGCFRSQNKFLNLVEYSQVVMLDIEEVAPENIDDIFTCICHDQFTYACFRDTKGTGFKLFVLTANEKHIQHPDIFEAVKNHYQKRLGTRLPDNGASIHHRCKVSYDPNAYINKNATPFAYSLDKTPPPHPSSGSKKLPRIKDLFPQTKMRKPMKLLKVIHLMYS